MQNTANISWYVHIYRKSICILHIFLRQLPLEELRDNYEKESAKLAEMMPPEVKEEPVEGL